LLLREDGFIMQLTDFLVVGGITLCGLAAWLIFKYNKKRCSENQHLAICFVLLGLIAGLDFVMAKLDPSALPWVFYGGVLIGYLLLPVFLVYVQRMLLLNHGIAWWLKLLHGLPFLVACLELIWFYGFNMAHPLLLSKMKLHLLHEHGHLFYTKAELELLSMNNIIRLLYGFLYIGLIAGNLSIAMRQGNFKQVSKREKKLVFVFYGMIVLYYLGLVMVMLQDKEVKTQWLHPASTVALLLFSVYFFGVSLQPFFMPDLLYAWNSHTEHLLVVAELTNHKEPEETTETKHHPASEETAEQGGRQLLSDKKLLEYAVLLADCMEKDQLFKRVSKLADLAEAIHISPRYLSYVLSVHYKQSFNDYVNAYRVSYIMEAIQQKTYEKFTLEAIGREAGFASRSTFFKVFKKHTGFSPTQFLENNL